MAKDVVYIYCIEYFIRGGVYIGSTTSPKSRQRQHQACTNSVIDFYLIDSCHRLERTYWENFYIQLYTSWGFLLINKRMAAENPTDIMAYLNTYERGLYDAMEIIIRECFPEFNEHDYMTRKKIRKLIWNKIKNHFL